MKISSNLTHLNILSCKCVNLANFASIKTLFKPIRFLEGSTTRKTVRLYMALFCCLRLSLVIARLAKIPDTKRQIELNHHLFNKGSRLPCCAANA